MAYFVLTLVAVTSTICAQRNLIEYGNDLYLNYKRDSALIIAEKAILIYKDIPDSLIMAHRLKNKVISVQKSTKDAVDYAAYVVNLASQILDTTSYQYLLTLKQYAGHLTRNYEYNSAHEVYERLLKLYPEKNDTLGFRAEIASEYATSLFFNRQFDESKYYGKYALALTEKIDTPDLQLLFTANRSLSIAYQYLAKNDSSLIYALETKKVAEKLYPRDHPNIGIVYNDLNGIYSQLGDRAKQYESLRKAEEILTADYQKTGVSRYLSVISTNLGLFYYNQGEMGLAMEYGKKGLQLGYKDNNKYGTNHLIPFMSLADITLFLGNADEALAYVDTIFQVHLKEDPGNAAQFAYMHAWYAKIYNAKSDHKKAKEYAQKSQAYYRRENEMNTKPAYAAMRALMDAEHGLGNHQTAYGYVHEISAIVDSAYGKMHEEHLINCTYFASELIDLGQYDEAWDYLQDGMDRYRSTSDKNLFKGLPYSANVLFTAQTASRIIKEQICSGSKDLEVMKSFILDFEAYYVNIINAFRSELSLLSHGNTIRQIYLNAWQAYHCNGNDKNDAEAVLLLEKSRSQLLRLITSSRLINQSFLSKEDQKQYQEFENKISELNALSFADNEGTGDISALSIQLDSFNLFKTKLRSKYKNYERSFSETFNPSWENIRKVLSKDEAMIAYFAQDSLLIVHVIEPDGKVSWDRLDFSQVEQLLERSEWARKDQKKANELYKILLPASAKKYEKLLIIPDASLYYLNFEILKDDEGKYLLESKQIRYGLSAALLASFQKVKERPYKNNFLAFAPGFTEKVKNDYLQSSPLIKDTLYLQTLQQPFMLRLLEGLKAVKYSQYFTEGLATESNYNKTSDLYNIIHFGTHGIVDDRSPMFSKLVLAKDSVSDGYLHTYEIFNKPVNADLVVLSACETGVGMINRGEGIMSMAYGFMYAGAPSIVMSLWDIDEQSSAQIISHFYTYLQEGKSKSEALRLAKLDYLSEAPASLKDPYYWAGLVFTGEDGPIVFVKPWWQQWPYLLALGLILFVLFMAFRKKIGTN
ncbi:MAG: CHAT domain-containing protein [Saprospiraceae bacterium]|nr:CHAT domain-containing protein [Saprospiraceae bacterium]